MENFNWNFENKEVTWKNNGIEIKKTITNAYFASVLQEKNLVYVEAGENYSANEIYYFSFDGKLALSLNKKNNSISWTYNDEEMHESYCNLIDAGIYNDNTIIVISDENLFCYDINGDLLFKESSSNELKFIRLTSINNTPHVVCDCGKGNEDEYGRKWWNFEIDRDNCTLTKKNLAY